MSPHAAPPGAATWLEHWPAPLHACSFAQRSTPLSPGEVRALGRRNGLATAAFGPEPVAGHDAQHLAALALRLQALLPGLPQARAFVRLGSRSPKDTPLALTTGLQVRSGAEAVAALCAGSARMAYDLRRALQAGLAPQVHLREWVDMAWHDEWRALLHGGRLLGLAPCHAATPLPDAVAPPAAAHAAATLLAPLMPLLQGAGLQPVVADVWLPPAPAAPRLIELNPWGPPTEAGLFDWQALPAAPQLRWRSAQGLVCAPLPGVASDGGAAKPCC